MTPPAKNQSTQVKGPEVFVGGLPLTVTENKLHEVFSDCGEIAEMRLIKDQKGNMKGFGFVKFATKEAAEKAVKEKNNIVLDGKKIGVLPSIEQNTLYFGNLNKGWSAHEFEGIVRQVFPDVVSVDLAMQTGSGERQLNRGFAFVKFSSHNAASRAYRVGSKEDFTLGGKLHPSVQWAEEGSEFDPDALAQIKIAFIRNLPTNADETYLKKLFDPFGEIEKVVLWKKGSSPVGFVHFAKRTDLDIAIKEMNAKAIQGPNGGPTSIISVEVARPMEKNKKRTREESEGMPLGSKANYVSENTPSAYSIGRTSIHNPTTVQKEATYVDPYEAAVVSLPGIVKERLLRILRLGIATRSDIDIHTINSLKELPDFVAISVLDQFMLSGADTKDKGIYLAGLIFKHHIDKQTRNESRYSHITERDSIGLSSYSSRDFVPTDVSRPSHVDTTLTSYNSRVHLPTVHLPNVHTNSSSTSFPISRSNDYDYMRRPAATSEYYPVSSTRTSMGIIPNESSLSHSPLLGNSTSSMNYNRRLSPQMPSTFDYHHQDRLKLNRQVLQVDDDDVSAIRDRLNGTSQLVSSIPEYRPTPPAATATATATNTAPQVRFDPYTGEPYKFDPYTGQPIVHSTSARRL